ncbi:UNVERIFIED_CONTAM: hypothetical protein GTU68_061013 [Idotea baltica]|nr:hypothetical protein [Idotea baltica]
MPLFNSSQTSITPILMVIDACKNMKPLPVAVFCGTGKPDVGAFLCDLVRELRDFSDGIVIDGHAFQLKSVVFLCDAPARAHLQCINYHTHRNGCGYCDTYGSSIEGRVVFPTVRGNQRTDDQYSQMLENNQSYRSPLLQIPLVGLYSSFPPDYLHLVNLGIMRRLCHFYFSKVKGFSLNCRLSGSQMDAVSLAILHCRKHLPSEFQRKLRPLKELAHYKGTEFRTFLLYLGPFLLRKHLPERYLHNFLLLHFSIYVFCSARFSHFFENAKCAIEKFVAQTPNLFSEKCVVYNFHVALHIPEFYEMYGPLDNWSTFFAENYLSYVKRRVKATSNINSHVVNTMSAIRFIYTNPFDQSLKFSNKSPDNCADSEFGIIYITDVDCENLVSGYRLKFVKDIYDYPYPSSSLNIGIYKKTDSFLSQVAPNNKCVCIDYKDNFLIIPFA